MRNEDVCPSPASVERIMSAPLLSLHRCCQRSALLLVARRPCSSSSLASRPPLHRRLLFFFTQRFYDVETALSWTSKMRRKQIQKKNVFNSITYRLYGTNIAAAFFVLKMKGGLRFVGQPTWFRTNRSGKFSWDFLNHQMTPIEEVDMSHTLINYSGLVNLEAQPLRTLSVRRCPEVDDWFLARLHLFQDSLEELDISHCPRITTGGLAALRNLKGLQRLDVSSLPGISNPGLVVILLEEMLPRCQITATGYDLRQEEVLHEQEQESKESGEVQKCKLA